MQSFIRSGDRFEVWTQYLGTYGLGVHINKMCLRVQEWTTTTYL